MRRRRIWWLFPLLVLALGGAAVGLWLTPSDRYILLPGNAQPVAPLVELENETAGPASDGAGIYMVDILVRRENLLERLWPGVEAGADTRDERQLNPHGVSERQRRETLSLDMTRSQQIAAAVALESLGYDVDATPSGAEIDTVIPDTPADGRLRPGDVIVKARGRDVKTPNDLREAMEGVEPGETVRLTYRRSGGLTDVTLGTQAATDDRSRAVVGVIVEQAASIDLPIDVKIDAGSIGGPSAGLAFALDIVDELGSDVDQGRRIVVTGELGLDGVVSAIGGVKQKAIGAEKAGADLFVVPSDNAEEAREYADGLEVVAVDDFDEALEALEVDPTS
jgi:Lon-like protease